MPLFDFIGMNGQARQLKIWSGRCESVREKTENWLRNYSFAYATHQFEIELKLRPIGDNTPLYELKEKWLGNCSTVNFVFDSNLESIAMFRNRGIFVFDCNQEKES